MSLFQKLTIFSVVIVAGLGAAFAQKLSRTDSLRQVFLTADHDTTKVLALASLAFDYAGTKPDTTIFLSMQGLAMSQKMGFLKGEERHLYNLGNAHYNQSNYQQALQYYQQCLELHEQLDDKRFKSYRLNDIGLIYLALGEFPKALDYYFQSAQIKEEINDRRGLSISWNNIALIYKRQKNYAQALEYHSRSLALAEEINSLPIIAGANNNIGSVYQLLGERDQALRYYQKALEIRRGTNDLRGMTTALNNVASVYLEIGQPDSALVVYEQSMQVLGQINYKTSEITAQNGLAKVHQQLGNLPRSIAYARKGLAMAEEIGAMEEVSQLSKTLYEVYKQQGAYEQAMGYHEQYKQATDSLFSQEKSKDIANLAALNEIRNKNREIDFLQQNQEILEQEKRLQQRFNRVILAALAVVVVLLMLLVFAHRRATKARNAMARQASELAELNETKNRLMAIIGHDLRDPIATLVQLLGLLKENDINQEDFSMVSGELMSRVEHVHATLENLLQWAYSQMQGITTKPAPVQLSALADEKIGLLAPLAAQKEIQLVQEVALALKVFADREQVKLVLRNLLSNAIKFTPQGGTITIKAQTNGTQVEVAVQDTGVGMKPEVLARLFTAKHSSTRGTNNEKGTGLGLMLCKDFVERNGGRIWVASEVGHGTTFYFSLPVHIA